MFQRKGPKPPRPVINLDRAKRAIVQVGPNGRGFKIGHHIIAAASCLPYLPAFVPFDWGRWAACLAT
jgi:hypothetical protein